VTLGRTQVATVRGTAPALTPSGIAGRVRGGAVLAFAILVAHAPQHAHAVTGDAAGDFTADELQRLAHGQLVERRTTLERGDLRLMGGTSWQVIDAPPDSVWRALLDTGHYPRMLPQVTEARLVREDGDHRTLFLRHGSGVAQTSYYLDVNVDSAQRGMTFHIDETRPRSIRAAFGYYGVRAYPGGRSLLVYSVMADIGDGLLTALLRSTVHEWMMKVPWLVKRFVEGSGHDLYSAR
jgi:hypothetical protein